VALELARDGVRVAVSGRSADKLQQLAAEHANIEAFPLDVTDRAKTAAVAVAIEKSLGPLDLVVFGAGNYKPVTADKFVAEDFDQMMDVNYRGVINGLAAMLPRMRARRAGHIAWIASVAGYRGLPKAAAYGPTKAALINLAECLQPELARDGVTVSIINPGFVKTPLTAQNDFPMPFLMEPEEAGRLTVKGLKARKFEIAYPWPFVTILKIMRVLPIALYLKIMRRQVLQS
jgi:NAD(P)-dependent dehydrogenase (short-subunit alcohol dehydrogenase family)